MAVRIILILLLLVLCVGFTFHAAHTSVPDASTGETAISQSLLEDLERRARTMEQRQVGELPRVDHQPTIDDVFDQQQWQDAAVWKLPWEINRGENRPTPADTYVLLMTSGSRIYVAFVNQDPEPRRIRAAFTDRDNWSRNEDDAVGFYLDPYDDARNAYRVMVNAAGIQADASRMDRGARGTEDDSSFDFLWHSEVKRFENGYIAQMSISLSNLQIPDTEAEFLQMGFMPFRMLPRDFTNKLSPVEWDFDRNCFLCQTPAIQIENPGREGVPVQFIPYASGISEGSGEGTDLTSHPTETTGAAGLDIKYQRGGSVFDATILPDFSQVETDAFQMTSNVRFVPTLSEQRPFFMERTDLFNFPVSQTLYTRSIVDPTAGARWTGKTDSHNWAIISLHDQTGWLVDPGPQTSRLVVDEQVNSWNNLFRYRYDHSADLMMGLFYSDRITEDGYNRLASYDAQIGIGSNHTLEFQGMGSWNRYPDQFADKYGVSTDRTFDYGYLLQLNRSGRNFDYEAEIRRFGDDLITGTGSLQQTGIQTASFNTGYNFWTDGTYLERLRLWFHSEGIWQLNRQHLTSVFDNSDLHSYSFRPGISFYGINRLVLQSSITFSHEIVEDVFGDQVYQQDFDLYNWWNRFSIDVTPDYRLSLNGSFGTTVDYRLIEELNEFDISISNSVYLWNRRINLSHSLDYMRLYHDVTAQEALTQRLSSEFQITRRFAIRNILQYRDFNFEEPRYEDVADQVRTYQNQTLLRYRLNYATAIYLGGFLELGEEAPRVVGDPIHEQSQWQVFAKISYLL